MTFIIENYWKFFKNNYYSSFQKQREIRKLPLNEIKKIQWKKLKKILEYVYYNNEFYRNYFESVNLTPDDIKKPEDMLKLPIVEKKILRKYFEKIISKNVNKDDYILSCTSGSSGEPFTFYRDKKRECLITYASFVLNKESMGIIPFKKINEIRIKVEPPNEVKNLNGEIERSLFDRIVYLFFSEQIGIRATDITKENSDGIFRIILNNKIEGIYGYPSSVLTLARHFSNYKTNLDIKYVITFGESLLEQQRKYISKIFDCPVYMDYGSSECERMGFECKYQNGFHMDIYNYYFEYLKKDGSYAKNNELGDVIVTNLNNYVFPFIRYKMADRMAVSNKMCECGINLPMIKKISGRTNDILITPRGKEVSGSVIDVFFEYLHEYLWQYQIIQTENDELLIKIVPTDKINDGKIKDIEQHMYDLVDKSMNVKVMLVKEIPVEKSGKKKVMILKANHDKMKKNYER